VDCHNPVNCAQPILREMSKPMLSWFQALMPKEERFFEFFSQHAELVVAGAEALRTIAGRLAKHATPQSDVFEGVRKATKREPGYAQQHGLNAPVDVYPLYENAGRAAYGQTFAEAQQESGEIWSRFSEIAAGNEGAWIRKPAAVEDITSQIEDIISEL